MSTGGKPIYHKRSAARPTSGSDKLKLIPAAAIYRDFDIAYRRWLKRRGLKDYGFRNSMAAGVKEADSIKAKGTR